MRITDELREWGYGFCGDTYEVVNAIADRIDAEHERLMQEQPFTVDMVPMTDERMAEHGWIRLPVDADGETWHLGDVLMMMGEVCEVVGIGGHTIFYASRGGVEWTIAHNNRHYHAPTVEDVLREFAQEMNENLGMYTGEAIDADEWRDADAKTVEKYAAKLRLREDA